MVWQQFCNKHFPVGQHVLWLDCKTQTDSLLTCVYTRILNYLQAHQTLLSKMFHIEHRHGKKSLPPATTPVPDYSQNKCPTQWSEVHEVNKPFFRITSYGVTNVGEKTPNNNKRLEPADQGKILSQILIIAPHSISIPATCAHSHLQ